MPAMTWNFAAGPSRHLATGLVRLSHDQTASLRRYSRPSTLQSWTRSGRAPVVSGTGTTSAPLVKGRGAATRLEGGAARASWSGAGRFSGAPNGTEATFPSWFELVASASGADAGEAPKNDAIVRCAIVPRVRRVARGAFGDPVWRGRRLCARRV